MLLGLLSIEARDEWMGVGQTVMPDAVPIVILRTFGPIELVYELSDTAPPQVRDPRSHMFGAEGPFDVGGLRDYSGSPGGRQAKHLRMRLECHTQESRRALTPGASIG